MVVEGPWQEVVELDVVKPAGELASLTPGPENGLDPALPPSSMTALRCPSDGGSPRGSAKAASSTGPVFLQDAAQLAEFAQGVLNAPGSSASRVLAERRISIKATYRFPPLLPCPQATCTAPGSTTRYLSPLASTPALDRTIAASATVSPRGMLLRQRSS